MGSFNKSLNTHSVTKLESKLDYFDFPFLKSFGMKIKIKGREEKCGCDIFNKEKFW